MGSPSPPWAVGQVRLDESLVSRAAHGTKRMQVDPIAGHPHLRLRIYTVDLGADEPSPWTWDIVNDAGDTLENNRTWYSRDDCLAHVNKFFRKPVGNLWD